MDRMEHFRDATVTDGDREVFAHAEGYLGFHEKSHGRKQWHGYFELNKDQHLVSGAHYQLHLTDGRVAEINAADVQGSDTPGKDVHIAEFYVVGEIRAMRRGLRDDGRHRHVLG